VKDIFNSRRDERKMGRSREWYSKIVNYTTCIESTNVYLLIKSLTEDGLDLRLCSKYQIHSIKKLFSRTC